MRNVVVHLRFQRCPLNTGYVTVNMGRKFNDSSGRPLNKERPLNTSFTVLSPGGGYSL